MAGYKAGKDKFFSDWEIRKSIGGLHFRFMLARLRLGLFTSIAKHRPIFIMLAICVTKWRPDSSNIFGPQYTIQSIMLQHCFHPARILP